MEVIHSVTVDYCLVGYKVFVELHKVLMFLAKKQIGLEK